MRHSSALQISYLLIFFLNQQMDQTGPFYFGDHLSMIF